VSVLYHVCNGQISWIAAIREEDRNRETKSEMVFRIENCNEDTEEKKDQSTVSPKIKFKKNIRKYSCTIDNLNRNTKYKIKLVGYEMKQYGASIVKDLNVPLIQFKTKRYCIDNKFEHKSDFDENGICYYFGTNYGKEQWQNPVKRGLLKVETNVGWIIGNGSDVLDRIANNCWTNNVKDACICVIFPENVKIINQINIS